MLLLNTVYGLVMTLMVLGGAILLGYPASWADADEFLIFWGGWTIGHVIYDIVAHWLVKYFNRDATITRLP